MEITIDNGGYPGKREECYSEQTTGAESDLHLSFNNDNH
jgi:hypothetical protein